MVYQLMNAYVTLVCFSCTGIIYSLFCLPLKLSIVFDTPKKSATSRAAFAGIHLQRNGQTEVTICKLEPKQQVRMAVHACKHRHRQAKVHTHTENYNCTENNKT